MSSYNKDIVQGDMDNKEYKFEHERISIDLVELCRSLWKNVIIIIAAVVVFAILGFVSDRMTSSTVYGATTRIIFQGTGSVENVAELTTCKEVMEIAADRLGGDYTVDYLRSAVSTEQPEETRVLEISATDADPDKAMLMANTIRDVAIEKIDEMMDVAVFEYSEKDKEKEVVKLGDMMGLGLIEILEDAEAPYLVSGPNPVKNIVIFAFLGLILAVGILSVKYLIHETTFPIRRPDDVNRYLDEDVLAAIPYHKAGLGAVKAAKGTGNNIVLNLKNSARTEEAYRFLRTNIMVPGAQEKVIGFTSPTSKEGKTTVSLQTARAMAEAGKKVLYIESDIRAPYLKGEAGVRGLSEILCGESTMKDVIWTSEYENLDVVLAGDITKASADMFHGEEFANVMKECREAYDYVILDTPPLRSYVDAAVIGEVCDGVVLVIKADSISSKLAMRVKEQLDMVGCRSLGVVLSQVQMKCDGYYGKYYCGYEEK